MPEVHCEPAALAELAEHCIDGSDPLLLAVGAFGDFGRQAADADDDLELLEVILSRVPAYRRNAGKATSRRLQGPGARPARDGDRHHRADQRTVLDACAHHLGAPRCAGTRSPPPTPRRAAGTLEFHDLLVLARRVLRDPEHGPPVRASLHQRYQRLLLDEFQDTDPIQIELAIAAVDPPTADALRADVEVAPGRLFVVGDPKQSIYRFRRADISTFLAARDRFGRARPAEPWSSPPTSAPSSPSSIGSTTPSPRSSMSPPTPM